MFKMNKRRKDSTFLTYENGKIIDTNKKFSIFNNIKKSKNEKPNINNDISAINDEKQTSNSNEDYIFDVSSESSNTEQLNQQPTNNLDNSEDSNKQIEDMFVSIFNIFKIIFISMIIAIIFFIGYKSFQYTYAKIKSSMTSNQSAIVSDTDKFNNQVNSLNVIKLAEQKQLKENAESIMNEVNTINDNITNNYNTTKVYVNALSTDKENIYFTKSNFKNYYSSVYAEYQAFTSKKSDFEKNNYLDLYNILESRYANLLNYIKDMSENAARSTIISKTNDVITKDNSLSLKQYDTLVLLLNKNGLDYNINNKTIKLIE